MRVALCISGMPRSFRRAYPSIKTNLIDPHSCDIFISTWKSEVVDEMFPETDSAEEFIELYNPIKFDIEIYNARREATFQTNIFHLRSDQAGRSVRRMIPMYYKIFLADLHRSIYEQENGFTYDVVVRCRSDLEFTSPVNFEAPKRDVVYFPEINSQNHVNDQFWYSDSQTATVVGSLYYAIPTLWHHGVFIHGETLLWSYLATKQIAISPVPIPYHILR